MGFSFFTELRPQNATLGCQGATTQGARLRAHWPQS
ncbi:MAG: hypothetical protein RLZZ346_1971 [Cyanobacteriota bacterium]|jgi:hypothetical protein